MLEQSSLWLSAPSSVWPPGLPRTGQLLRRVFAADTKEPLGHVAITPGRWLPWPTGRRLAVFETPDASLLFSARLTGWIWPVTVVAEADGHIIAREYGSTVSVPSRQFVAQRGVGTTVRAGMFTNRAGSVLVGWEPSDGGTAVHFVEEVRREPFVKMGLLAAVLMET